MGLAYVVLSALVMKANPFEGETVAPMDLLTRHEGWQQFNPSGSVEQGQRSDILDCYLPRWIQVKRSLREGGNPWWIPEAAGGVPGLHHFTNGTLTPSFLVFTLIEADWLGYYLGHLLRLSLAGLGMYLLLRMELNRPASFFGGTVFMLAGFQAAWFFWPQITTSMWIPWVLWSAGKWYRTEQPIWLPVTTLTALLLLLGGFPSVALFGGYALALFTLCHLPLRTPLTCLRLGGAAVGAFLLAGLLSAIPFLSLMELLEHTDLSYRTGGTVFSFPEHLKLFWNPEPLRVETTLYMGKVALFLPLVALPLFLTSRLTRFGIISGLMCFLILFGLLPATLVEVIPGFSFNPWGRVAVILHLCFAVLSGAGIHLLFRIRERLPHPTLRTVAIAGCTLLMIGQFIDQTRFFRDYNAVTPKEWFYPETPSLTFVQDRLDPLQTVLADDSYFLGGTLVPYGLPEWYADGFRFAPEPDLLSQLVHLPFATPLAAKVRASSIDLNSDLHDALGIRFLLLKDSPELDLRLSSRVAQQHPGGAAMWVSPAIPDASLRQPLVLKEHTTVRAVSLILHTHRQLYAQAPVLVSIETPQGESLATARVGRREALNNTTALFVFPEGVTLSPGRYHLAVRYSGKGTRHPLSVWMAPHWKSEAKRLRVNGASQEGTAVFTLYTEGSPTLADRWQKHQKEEGLVILENLKLQTPPAQFGKDGALQIDLPTDGEGTFVVPTRSYPGMQWTLNGEEVQPTLHQNLLPEFTVPDASQLRMHYTPTAFRAGVPLTLLGVMAFACLVFITGKQN